MHLFFSKPTRALAALADESLDRLAGAPLRVGVQMRLGGGEWNDPERYSSMLPPQRCQAAIPRSYCSVLESSSAGEQMGRSLPAK